MGVAAGVALATVGDTAAIGGGVGVGPQLAMLPAMMSRRIETPSQFSLFASEDIPLLTKSNCVRDIVYAILFDLAKLSYSEIEEHNAY